VYCSVRNRRFCRIPDNVPDLIAASANCAMSQMRCEFSAFACAEALDKGERREVTRVALLPQQA